MFSGSAGNYTVTYQADGSYVVVGTDGTDTLTNIEQIQFGTTTPVAIGSLIVPEWFDASSYLASKAAALNAARYGGRTDWTAAEVLAIFTSAGITPYQHYKGNGSLEGLNPNSWFNQAYYLQEKAAALNAAAYSGRTDWTSAEVLQAITSSGISVFEHYVQSGQSEGLNPNITFNETYYLQQKAAALNALAYNGRTDWKTTEVLQAITSSGLTIYEHYVKFGQAEGLNPNAYFDETYYLQAKVNLLNSQAYSGRTNWTTAEVFQAITSSGLTVYQHFAQSGVNEGLNPSASFNVQTYLANKALALNTANYNGRTNWSAAEVLSAIESAGIDPITHYLLCGLAEGISPTTKATTNALTATYASGVLSLTGTAGAPVTVTLNDAGTAAITSTGPLTVTTVGTDTGVLMVGATRFNGSVVLNGNSTLNFLGGTANNDTLCGGRGHDELQGGNGADTFVFHFGDATTNSDSILDTNFQTVSSVADIIDDFTLGTDNLSFRSSSGVAENPSAIYYGGAVTAKINELTDTISITLTDNTTATYTLQQYSNAISVIYTSILNDKNGTLHGGSLGANEGTVVNLTLTDVTTSVSTSASLMFVNDSNAVFDNRDISIMSPTPFTGSYDTSTGLIAKSLLLGS